MGKEKRSLNQSTILITENPCSQPVSGEVRAFIIQLPILLRSQLWLHIRNSQSFKKTLMLKPQPSPIKLNLWGEGPGIIIFLNAPDDSNPVLSPTLPYAR